MAEEVLGSFYNEELQKVSNPDVFRSEKIIRNKTVNGKKEVLVKWLGYSDKFNSWIPAGSVSEYGERRTTRADSRTTRA